MDRMDDRARPLSDRPNVPPRHSRAVARRRGLREDARRCDVERGSVSVLSLRFVSTRRRVPVRAPGDGDGDVIVNGARDVVDDERDVCVRRARVEKV